MGQSRDLPSLQKGHIRVYGWQINPSIDLSSVHKCQAEKSRWQTSLSRSLVTSLVVDRVVRVANGSQYGMCCHFDGDRQACMGGKSARALPDHKAQY